MFDIIGIGAWQTVYAMLLQFSMALQTEILFIETPYFLKQIILLKSFNFPLSVVSRAIMEHVLLYAPYNCLLTVHLIQKANSNWHYLKPIAFRMAKTQWNFGRSDCNMVTPHYHHIKKDQMGGWHNICPVSLQAHNSSHAFITFINSSAFKIISRTTISPVFLVCILL